MIIVYTPAEGEPEHFDARSLRVSEVSIVSRTINQKWPLIKQGLADDDLDAMRGIAWVIKKRGHPSLPFDAFDPGIEELTTKLDKTEVVTWITEALAIASSDTEVTGDELAEALRGLSGIAFDPDHAEAMIKEMVDSPKGSGEKPALEEASLSSQSKTNPESTSSESSTSDSSPAG